LDRPFVNESVEPALVAVMLKVTIEQNRQVIDDCQGETLTRLCRDIDEVSRMRTLNGRSDHSRRYRVEPNRLECTTERASQPRRELK
jgi:hypothetical protein